MDAPDRAAAERSTRDMCQKLLANPVIEDFEIASVSHFMKFGIVTFPGSNCDYDAYHAVVDGLGEEAVYLWHKDHDLRGSDVSSCPVVSATVTISESGAIARFSPIMREVIAHAERGAPVMGFCNGFQIMCEAGCFRGPSSVTPACDSSARPCDSVSRMLTPNSPTAIRAVS